MLFSYNKNNNIDTYIVYDENYEDQQTNLNRIKSFIDEINSYNNSSSYKIKGLTIDSEFHTLESFRNLTNDEQIEVFSNYVNAIKEAYVYAKNYNLDFVVCIPVWLDRLDINLLDSLIKDGCDYVQLMNYTKSNMVESIAEEVEIAKKYNKKIENIAELQEPGNHGVTNEISFYNDGIEACNNKFIEIDNYYSYSLLTFSYHYYKPLISMIEEINDTNNYYSYEINPKREDGTNINLTKTLLSENDDKLYPIYITNKNSNEFILHFYGLEYGKKYILQTEDTNYELLENKEIYNEQDNEKIKKEDVFFKIREYVDENNNIEEENINPDENMNHSESEKQDILEEQPVVDNQIVEQVQIVNNIDDVEPMHAYVDDTILYNADLIINNTSINDYEVQDSEYYNNDSYNDYDQNVYQNKQKKKNNKRSNNKVKKDDLTEKKLSEQTDYKVSLIVIVCLISISLFLIIKNIVYRQF